MIKNMWCSHGFCQSEPIVLSFLNWAYSSHIWAFNVLEVEYGLHLESYSRIKDTCRLYSTRKPVTCPINPLPSDPNQVPDII